ncbi:hypothetical protein LSM04_004678 [Trypanosoma melophagium]|uniref:uncharacterized protein n=1 Tax=Trypanosoma melophagium TaxID=715481 RepID=UPI00351A3C2C|nr:hypothetical protein LSM04_004678 [Trypanosoma melophagium]
MGDGDGANSITSSRGNGNDKNNSVVETEMQSSTSQHIVQAVYAAVSQWNCVSDMMLSEYSISLEYIRQTVCAFCSNTKTPMNGKINELHQAEYSDGIKKLRGELSSVKRTAKDFEEWANEHALEVVNLKREMTTLREQKHQLEEKLSRTEKALLLANWIEKRLSKQLQQQQEKQIKYMIIITYEWEKRHALTRRNTVALEQTTASIKVFQDDLNRREEELRVREREIRLRRTRLLEVSNALQTVAGRLRAAAITEEGDEACKLGSG